jgi:hypothetical protein
LPIALSISALLSRSDGVSTIVIFIDMMCTSFWIAQFIAYTHKVCVERRYRITNAVADLCNRYRSCLFVLCNM